MSSTYCYVQKGGMVHFQVIAFLLFYLLSSSAYSESSISGFFGQNIGQELSNEPLGIFKGSESEPNVHYIVPVPTSFPLKYFKNYIAVVDTDTKLVGGVYAKIIANDAASCLAMKKIVGELMSKIYINAKKHNDSSYSDDPRNAEVWCSSPVNTANMVLSISVSDDEFSFNSEKKYIQKLLKVN